MKEIYIVVGCCGEYSDYYEWYVGYRGFTDKQAAEKLLSLCLEHLNTNRQRRNPYDSSYNEYSHGVTYRLDTIKIDNEIVEHTHD